MSPVWIQLRCVHIRTRNVSQCSVCANFTKYSLITGVADGVGGWSSVGIDASHFSKALMNSCTKVSKQRLTNLNKPVDIMNRALKETLWLHSKVYGK